MTGAATGETDAATRAAVSAVTALATDALSTGLGAHGVEVVAVERDPARLVSAVRATGAVDVVVVSLGALAGDGPGPAAGHDDAAIDVAALGAPLLVVGDDADEQLEQAMRLGAAGYAAWSQPLSAVADAAHRVAAGESLVPPGMLGGLLRRLIERNRAADDVMVRLAQLSVREREALALLCDGCDHDAIAERLVVSPQTARSHVARVLSKLGAHSRAEAVAMVCDHGLRPALEAMEVPT